MKIVEANYGEDNTYNYTHLQGKELVRFFKSPPAFKKTLGIDIETYAKDKYKDHADGGLTPVKTKIRLIQIDDGVCCYVLDFMEEDGSYTLKNPWIAEQLQKLLLSHKLIAHNALFETAHLQNLFTAHYGKAKPLNIMCTKNMYRLILCAEIIKPKTRASTLAAVVKDVFSIDLPKEEQRSDWSNYELTKSQLDYAALDAHIMRPLAGELIPLLTKHGLEDVFDLNTKAQEAVVMMQLNGSTVNVAAHRELWDSWLVEQKKAELECLELLNEHLTYMDIGDVYEELTAKVTKRFVEDMRQQLDKYVDIDFDVKPYCFYELEKDLSAQEEVEKDEKGRRRALRRVIKNLKILLTNPSSGPGVSTWLKVNLEGKDLKQWPLTDSGDHLKTNGDTFDEFSHVKEVGPIHAYKKVSKLVSTYGVGLHKFFVDLGDRTAVYAGYTLCYTDTGRMSSKKPNFQNLPRGDAFRSLWVAESEDHKLLCADFSQVELRIAAYMSQDPTMVQAYDTGEDLHRLTASSISGIAPDKINKEQRQKAKACNFGLLYGSGPGGLQAQCISSYGVDMSIEQAEEYVDIFRENYPRYREWQMEQAEMADTSLKITTPTGKLRKLEAGKSYTVSMNHPIQGAAAEIMLHSLVNITHALLESDYEAYLVNCVHDEVIVNCHEDDVEPVKQIIKDGMEKGMLTVFPEATTLNLVDVNVGDNWNEAK